MIAARSLVVRSGIRVAGPLAIVVGTYLFFAGHNRPGGGFAAGLVFGAVAALRMMTGLPTWRRWSAMLTAGGVLVGIVALAPLVVGEPLLDQRVVSTTLPGLGKVKTGTALVFDAGVTLIVMGLMIAVLDALGIDRLVDEIDEIDERAEIDEAAETAETAGGEVGG